MFLCYWIVHNGDLTIIVLFLLDDLIDGESFLLMTQAEIGISFGLKTGKKLNLGKFYLELCQHTLLLLASLPQSHGASIKRHLIRYSSSSFYTVDDSTDDPTVTLQDINQVPKLEEF